MARRAKGSLFEVRHALGEREVFAVHGFGIETAIGARNLALDGGEAILDVGEIFGDGRETLLHALVERGETLFDGGEAVLDRLRQCLDRGFCIVIHMWALYHTCLLYTSDAADERS